MLVALDLCIEKVNSLYTLYISMKVDMNAVCCDLYALCFVDFKYLFVIHIMYPLLLFTFLIMYTQQA